MRPAALNTSAACPFAHTTMRTRLPSVIRTVAFTNARNYAPEILVELEAFAKEVEAGAPLRHIAADTDVGTWRCVYDAWGAAGWHAMPWYAAEAYLYRVLLQVCQYHDPMSSVHWLDPFLPQKLGKAICCLFFSSLSIPCRLLSYFRCYSRAYSTFLRGIAQALDVGLDQLGVANNTISGSNCDGRAPSITTLGTDLLFSLLFVCFLRSCLFCFIE
jgi:hypothetical protein